MPDTDAIDRAEEIGGPSDDYEPPDLTDADPDYEEGEEEPSGLGDEYD